MVLILCILVVVIISTERRIREEEKKGYESAMSNVVGIADKLLEEYYREIEASLSVFTQFDNSTFEKLAKNIEQHETIIQKEYVSVLLGTDDGNIYSSKGKRNIQKVSFTEETVFVYKEEMTEFFNFAKEMTQSIKCDDLTFKYFIYSVPFEIIRPYFTPIGVKENYIAILKQDGEVLFDINGQIESNFFPYIKGEMDFGDKEKESIIQEIKANLSNCRRLNFKDGISHMAYQKLRGWTFISISPVNRTFSGPEWRDFYVLLMFSFIVILFVATMSAFYTGLMIIKRNDARRSMNILTQKNEDLSNAVDVANAANAAKSDFLSRISHDIRTPMNGIVGMTHIAKKSIDDKERVEYCLSKIEQASNHLLDLLNGVLELSKIESGIIQVNPTPTNMVELFGICEDMLVSQSKKMSLQLETKMDIIHDFMIVDDLRLKQVVINILSNAVKFNKENGNICFKVNEEIIGNNKSNLKIVVTDTGRGMSEEFLKNVFEPFVQEDCYDARTIYKGSGLGMAIVKEILDLMGGTINVESKENVGTTVSINLPVEYLCNSQEENEESEENSALAGMKVLLVEDNEINMEIAESLLQEVGIIVDKAFDGMEALEKFSKSKENWYEVILMDVLMPRMDGYEATKRIKSLNRIDKDIPIVAMTANAYDEDKKKAIECGMQGYISKPIQIQKLYDILLKLKTSENEYN